EMSHHEEVLNRMAESLSESRKSHIPDFIDTLKGLLSDLGMPHATFVIEMEPSTALTPSGKDAIRFLFAANKGGQPAAIKDVASGGEISRLTLSIKSMVAAAIPLPSLIFDEIDTGLGGEIALKMAEIMREMAREHQLIAITHSPQLASKADKHFFVYKEIEDNNTFTRIKELSLDERIENIAIMLSTKPPTKAAVENARELLERK
ncbi:MAG TPA: DNA repair protein RecN, partial [Saprospiraceae bacterium]|nr:DNA repair protein RecN [Saprospiraceae bacterium]